MNIVETVTSVFLIFLHVALVVLLREMATDFLFPRLKLSKGVMGSQFPASQFVAKVMSMLSLFHFEWKRDWMWAVVLTFQVFTLSQLPVTGNTRVLFERPGMALLTFFLTTRTLILLVWWIESKGLRPTLFLKHVQATFVSLAAIIMIIVTANAWTQSDSLALNMSANTAMSNPIMLIGLVSSLVLAPAFRVEIPLRAEGWGLEASVQALGQVFWFTLLVVLFLGRWLDQGLPAFVETVVKTALLFIVCDLGSVFFSAVRRTTIDQINLALLIPLSILSAISLLWRMF